MACVRGGSLFPAYLRGVVSNGRGGCLSMRRHEVLGVSQINLPAALGVAR